MSFTEQLAEIEKAKAKLAQAEAKLAAERQAALARLPADFGFADVNDFIQAVKEACSKGAKVKRLAKSAKAEGGEKAGKRAKITDEMKAQVKTMTEAGKTASEIASALGISQPSVQNIRKQFGLVKSRATSAASAPAPAEAAPAEPAPAAVPTA